MDRLRIWSAFVISTLVFVSACAEPAPEVSEEEQEIFLEELLNGMPNNIPIPNSGGLAASASTDGYVALDNNFFTAQGTNGRSCGSCHAPEDGWGLNGSTATTLFLLTGGTHPLFNIKDADTPTSDLSTIASRWSSFSMLRKGMFTRSNNVPTLEANPNRDFDVIAVDDPFGVSTTSRLWYFRRSMPTANFRSPTVSWDGANTQGTDLHAGLARQVRGNITGAQEGAAPTDETVESIVQYEMSMGHAQLIVPGAGRLDASGAKGGPLHAAQQPLVQGRFDLYDAWAHSGNPHRKQIYRGQEIFNNVNQKSGKSCSGCHNAANNGQNVAGLLFDVGASDVEWARADAAIFTLQRISDGAIVQTTDPGRAVRSWKFADMNKFKTPNLRGLAARAPYFHNGIAKDLPSVVKFYEQSLGFDFTHQEEKDLAAFLNAL